MTPHGRFITIEGGDGAGKTTQALALVQALKHAAISVVATREPGGTPGADAIRSLLLAGDEHRWDAETEVLLFTAARRDLVRRVIAPALASEAVVVCDRFIDSTTAYQGAGRGVSRVLLAAAQGIAIGDLRPDLTLILDVPPEVAAERTARRRELNRFDRMNGGFHERVRAAFKAIADMHPGRCVLIDAAGPAWAVHRQILSTVSRRLGIALTPVIHPDPEEDK
ncbi:MAG: dTMP kinase [Alphaproteobacteria bacterium]